MLLMIMMLCVGWLFGLVIGVSYGIEGWVVLVRSVWMSVKRVLRLFIMYVFCCVGYIMWKDLYNGGGNYCVRWD